ncbi:MAG: hypothetical protein ACOYN3_01350 [Acidimicrobiia bacterium]
MVVAVDGIVCPVDSITYLLATIAAVRMLHNANGPVQKHRAVIE